jgi:predicted pyridoxine 5'-phosphate oxidase superfamily flavin-nucleotide-binding protein
MADTLTKPAAEPLASALTGGAGSVWHEGEMALQEKAGVRRIMERQGAQVIRDHLIDQHRLFFPLLPSIIMGAVDSAGNVWSTVREGSPGFLSAPNAKTLDVGVDADPSDPAETGLREGCAVGLLGIQLGTRRRNRLNGIVSERRRDGLSVTVRESYGNCPQYVQLCNFEFSRVPGAPAQSSHQEFAALDDAHRALIALADTFFVASYVDRGNRRQVDVSHRGGKPGFVRVNADGSLTIPDFAGNLYFNTLGNILISGRAGLCFPDFETGAMLQISGKAEVILDSPEIEFFQGAERLWRVIPERVIFRPNALAPRWKKVEGGESPNSLMTGGWDDVAQQQQVAVRSLQWPAVPHRSSSAGKREHHLLCPPAR